MKICFDVGGTEIKAGLFHENNELIFPVLNYMSMADQSCATIVKHFVDIYIELCKGREEKVTEIAFAFPGPFDYEKGISYIHGIDKYESLYGKEFEYLFRKELEDQGIVSEDDEIKIWFINDVSAFACGFLFSNEINSNQKSMFVCLGTGCGSAFAIGRNIVGDEVKGVPADGYIYNAPFKHGIVDDFLSKRGLTGITENIYGRKVEGLELSCLARVGDDKAIEAFSEFGENIKNGLMPFLKEFQPNYLVIGGQVVKSKEYFLNGINNWCAENKVILNTEDNTSLRSMQGMLLKNKN